MIRRLWKDWKVFARTSADFQARVLVGLFYFFVAAPFAAVARASRGPAQLRRSAGSSHWLRARDTTASLDQANKQS